MEIMEHEMEHVKMSRWHALDLIIGVVGFVEISQDGFSTQLSGALAGLCQAHPAPCIWVQVENG